MISLMVSAACFGQTPTDVGNGFKPYGSYEGGSLDSVSLEDGNVILHAPVVPGTSERGGQLGPQLMLYMSSKNFSEHCDLMPNPANCFWAYGGTGITFQLSADMVLHRSMDILSDPIQ